MAIRIRQREFVGALASAAPAWPLVARGVLHKSERLPCDLVDHADDPDMGGEVVHSAIGTGRIGSGRVARSNILRYLRGNQSTAVSIAR